MLRKLNNNIPLHSYYFYQPCTSNDEQFYNYVSFINCINAIYG